MDLVPTVDDDLVICGAPLMSTPANSELMSSIRDQANQVLDEWFTHTEQWVRVAVHQTTGERTSITFKVPGGNAFHLCPMPDLE
ncbi:hypothetical protein PF007_g27197 [Phytophthora fragariae]|nr:hypothetical protein PF007_g27197 [Phytophthora fragariae]